MQTTIDKQKNSLLKRYHTMLGKLGIGNDEKLMILAQYGVESGKDLTVDQLIDLCTKLDMMLNPEYYEAEKWRRRVMAAIGAWLRLLNKDGGNMALIKSIAMRASGAVAFNEIPTDRLRSLYAAFVNKKRDLRFVEEVTAEEIGRMASEN